LERNPNAEHVPPAPGLQSVIVIAAPMLLGAP
jgi:hypothetical protein